MSNDNELNEVATKAVLDGARAIMDLRVRLCADGVLAPSVDKGLTAAVSSLMSYSGSLPEAILNLLNLKAEYEPKMKQANEDQFVKYSALIGQEQIDEMLKDPRRFDL